MLKNKVHYYEDAREVPKDIYQQLYRLNRGQYGCMREGIVEARKKNPGPYLASVGVLVSPEGKVLSWSLLDMTGLAQFYTRVAERRKGYALKVAKVMVKQEPELHGAQRGVYVIQKARTGKSPKRLFW